VCECVCVCVCVCVGLARTTYIRCICGIFGREITKYTVIYGVYIRFWPTLKVSQQGVTARNVFAKSSCV
jgi:hypothetical protein